MAEGRWVEVTPSQFAHERDGLEIVRRLLPEHAPFRAWSNFEFRDGQGRWAEVDLLLLAPDGLHLVELKYYSGTLRGNDQVWYRSGHAAEDSPLRLANSKAKRLRTVLMDAYRDWLRRDASPQARRDAPSAQDVIPYVQESVFLHHPGLVCELPDASRQGLFGPPDSPATDLAPITDLLAGTPRPGSRIHETAVVQIMARIGLRAPQRTAGSYVLDARPFRDGQGWQDWLGTHRLLPGERRRIRFRLIPPGATAAEEDRARRLTAHELQVMQRLSHDAILRPEDYVDSELGPGLVYPFDPDWQRLDLWLAANGEALTFEAQLGLIRQLAEALGYAHRKHVVHRRLNPRAVLIRADGAGRLRLRITDWQGAGRTDDATGTALTRGITTLAGRDSGSSPLLGSGDAFTAPEGAFDAGNDRVRLDVFSLGALAFYVLTGGELPATSGADLRARLRSQGGLDLSVELPSAPPRLRELILEATRGRVSDRLPDVAAFLARLDDARPAGEDTEAGSAPADPLDAGPGATLGGRFLLRGRLGAGSTAVGLLVTDLTHPDEDDRVLKVAIDDAAAARLADEAEAIAKLRDKRVVALVEGPLDVDGRRALLLESAGRETLATHLGDRKRLSLDRLERWGTDLLEIVTLLDSKGITHRDIKPANLGVRQRGKSKALHLTLFDFSLTKAPVTDVHAGTRPYLDPFLDARRPYDSAAERYAAAVVLFEMATGHTPVYGDGLSDPSSIRDDVAIDTDDFDPSARAGLAAFFGKALARNVADRHHTVAEMLLQWRVCFPDASVHPVDADALAGAATADTPLAASGLSPRALSALEQLQVATVGDLAAVDAARLNVLSGSNLTTRNEIKALARLWRGKFGRKGRSWTPVGDQAALPAPHDSADILLAAARTGREDSAAVLASRLLGVTGDVSPNATQAEFAASFEKPLTPARVGQLIKELQARWSEDADARDLLDLMASAVDARLGELGGVATFDDLADALLGWMLAVPADADLQQQRLTAGLLRCALDRRSALASGQDDEHAAWVLRRRDNRPVLVATEAWLLDLAEALAGAAEDLVGQAGIAEADPIVPEARVADRLAAVAREALAATGQEPAATPLVDVRHAARLTAHLAGDLGASAVGELHRRGLAPVRALQAALRGLVPGSAHTPDQLRERVAARFPDLARLPERPALDDVVARAFPGMHWDTGRQRYVAPGAPGGTTTGLESRPATNVTPPPPAGGMGAVGQRLSDSRERRSFLALGVSAARLQRLTEVLEAAFDARPLDLAATLMASLHEQAARAGMDWSTVLAADAEAPTSRPGQGLRALIGRALPDVDSAIEAALAEAGDRPLLLVDASLLVRYRALDRLAGWMDLSTRRPTAIWLAIPQLHANLGPMVDGRPLPLTAPNQYVEVPNGWVDAHRLEGSLP